MGAVSMHPVSAFLPSTIVACGWRSVMIRHGAWEIFIRSGVLGEVGLSSGGCGSGS